MNVNKAVKEDVHMVNYLHLELVPSVVYTDK